MEYLLVVEVIDGDTFDGIDMGGELKRIRLQKQHAPEMRQLGGIDAQQRLDERIRDKMVGVKIVARDKYGRLVAEVWLDDNRIG